MPAQLVAGTVTVSPYSTAQSFRLSDQLLAGHCFEILVHYSSGGAEKR
jgi:hypothetical protein